MPAESQIAEPNIDVSAFDDAALAPLGGDAALLESLDRLAALSHRPAGGGSEAAKPAAFKSSGFAKLRAHHEASLILKHGFGAKEHVYEKEGSDSILFASVPDWIKFKPIRGCRYRQVVGISDPDPDDDWAHQKAGVRFIGYPGASGWADKIGDVAVHYMHEGEWAVFSRLYPFNEQSSSKEAHEDVLLLGSAKNVMITPACVQNIGPEGLSNPATVVELLNAEGSPDRRAVHASDLPSAVKFRLYMTWGHADSPFKTEVLRHERKLDEVASEPERMPHKLSRLFQSWGGARIKVKENWNRYPELPLDPAYYNQLLAVTTSMTTDEEVTRELLQPEPSKPSSSASTGQVSVEIDALGDKSVSA